MGSNSYNESTQTGCLPWDPLFSPPLARGTLPPVSAISGVPVFSASSTSASMVTAPIASSSKGLFDCKPALQSWNPAFTLSTPPKLQKKILDLEYVEMSELVTDSWRVQEEDQSCCHQRRTRRGPVTEILLWVDCFATMVSVLSTRYPDKMPQLMAYQQTIIKAVA